RSHQLCVISLVIIHHDLDIGGVLNHVIVGDDVTIVRNDHSRTRRMHRALVMLKRIQTKYARPVPGADVNNTSNDLVGRGEKIDVIRNVISGVRLTPGKNELLSLLNGSVIEVGNTQISDGKDRA